MIAAAYSTFDKMNADHPLAVTGKRTQSTLKAPTTTMATVAAAERWSVTVRES